MREETRCRYIGYSFRLTARVLLYAPSHRQDSTYHSLCYTSRGALAGTRNSSMCPLHDGSIRRSIAPWANALTMELHLAPRLSLGMVTANSTSNRGEAVIDCINLHFKGATKWPFLKTFLMKQFQTFFFFGTRCHGIIKILVMLDLSAVLNSDSALL